MKKTISQYEPKSWGNKPGASSARKPSSGTGYTRTATSRSTGKKTINGGVTKPITQKEYASNTGGMSKIKKPKSNRSTGGNKF